jgi:ADP-heptose:LPS heptosyltransferase
VTIINRCKYIDKVISTEETPPHFDVYLEIISLPCILKTRLDTIPCAIPYLYGDEQLTEDWKKELAPDKNFKIGICWQVNENCSSLATRTMAAQRSIKLKQLIPLCTIPGTTIYCLQKFSGTEQLDDLPNEVKIITFDGDFDQSNGRFMDTAAVIKNLDLVITVDTSIAHLAGGLGVDTWLMRSSPTDWRWLMNRTDSPWYPTIRLFKQPTHGDWETMVQEIVEEVKKRIEKK